MTQNLKGVIIADPEREIHSLERTNAKLLRALLEAKSWLLEGNRSNRDLEGKIIDQISSAIAEAEVR